MSRAEQGRAQAARGSAGGTRGALGPGLIVQRLVPGKKFEVAADRREARRGPDPVPLGPRARRQVAAPSRAGSRGVQRRGRLGSPGEGGRPAPRPRGHAPPAGLARVPSLFPARRGAHLLAGGSEELGHWSPATPRRVRRGVGASRVDCGDGAPARVPLHSPDCCPPRPRGRPRRAGLRHPRGVDRRRGASPRPAC